MSYNLKNDTSSALANYENKVGEGEKKKEINFISFKSFSLNFLDFGVKTTL